MRIAKISHISVRACTTLNLKGGLVLACVSTRTRIRRIVSGQGASSFGHLNATLLRINYMAFLMLWMRDRHYMKKSWWGQTSQRSLDSAVSS